MPQAPVPELILHMLPHRHAALSKALYASPHGGPIRMLPLVLESGTIHYEFHVPCSAVYDRFSKPVVVTTPMTRAEWYLLHTFAQEEGVLQVIMSPDEGETDFLGKLTVAVEEVETLGIEKGSVAVEFLWRERGESGGERVEATIRKGLAWVRKKASGLG